MGLQVVGIRMEILSLDTEQPRGLGCPVNHGSLEGNLTDLEAFSVTESPPVLINGASDHNTQEEVIWT